MSEISIRPATLDDLGTIIDFSARLAVESEGIDLDREVLAAGIGSALEDSSRARYFLAETAGEVAGQLMITYEWSDWRNAFFWWIQSVYVKPDYRRQGVYKSLHFYAAEVARQEGNVGGLRLYVDKGNTIAQGVYSGLRMRPTNYDMYEIDFDARPARVMLEPESDNEVTEGDDDAAAE